MRNKENTKTKKIKTRRIESKRIESRRTILILFLLILFFIILRIPSINHAIANDEYHPLRIISSENPSAIIVADGSGHPPFYVWMNYLFFLMLGDHNYTYRIASLIFSIFSIVLLYLIAKREFGEKTAIISSLIMTISSWFVIGSLQVHLDAPYLVFFYLLVIYLFFKYEDTKNIAFLILFGIAFGLMMLTKISAILMILIIISFIFFRTDKKWKIKQYILPSIFLFLGLIIFITFLLITKIYVEGDGARGLNIGVLRQTYVVGGEENLGLGFSTYLIQLGLAGIFATPLIMILLFPLFGLFRTDKEKIKKYFPYLFWIFINLAFYLFLVTGLVPSYERWFIAILPAIAILGARYIATMNFRKKDMLVLLIAAIISIVLFTLLNNLDSDTMSLHPKSDYIDRIKSLDFNFNVPITGNAGPAGFYLSFPSIAVAFVICLIFVLLSLIHKNKSAKRSFFILFLGSALAFNLLVIEEHSYGLLNYNINSATTELVEWANTNALDKPVYVFGNYALTDYYLRKHNPTEILIGFEDDDSVVDEVKKNPGTAVVLDFPGMNKDSKLWKYLLSCERLKTVYDKDYPIGYVFGC